MERPKTNSRKWVKFFLGVISLLLFYSFFASGYTPPGIFGKVLRHNQTYNVDATALFYTELERMSEYEEGVQELRKIKNKGHQR
jgi:hypothetical protein